MQPAAYLVPKCSTGAPKQPQKPPKWPILPISAKNGHFGHFGGFWGPPCAPCGPFWAQIGLWLHTSGCILPFWWLRNHSEPSQMKKNFLKKIFFSVPGAGRAENACFHKKWSTSRSEAIQGSKYRVLRVFNPMESKNGFGTKNHGFRTPIIFFGLAR